MDEKLITEVMDKMIKTANGDLRDIAHFTKVYAFAHLIALGEGIDDLTRLTLEITAVIHDIACPLCREKYGSASGKRQEEESAPLVSGFLKDFAIDTAVKERINYLVCHHHTYTDVDGPDYRILLEADFLVNADESKMSAEAVRAAKNEFFRTKTGTALLEHMYSA